MQSDSRKGGRSCGNVEAVEPGTGDVAGKRTTCSGGVVMAEPSGRLWEGAAEVWLLRRRGDW